MIKLFNVYSVELPKKSPVKKHKKSTWGVHFTIFPASLCATEFYEIWHTRSTHWRNHVSNLWSIGSGVTEFWYPKIAISHWLTASPLQQCMHCLATLKWQWWLSTASRLIAAYRRTHSQSQVAWSECRRPLALFCIVLQSAFTYEPSELSQWPCGHDDSSVIHCSKYHFSFSFTLTFSF